MAITVTIDQLSLSFDCDLSDEQLAILVAEGAITLDRETGLYWFDDARIGEDWNDEDFGPDELIKLANVLLRLPRHDGELTDAEALDLIAYCLSAPEWSVSFLEDIDAIVGRTSHSGTTGAYWRSH